MKLVEVQTIILIAVALLVVASAAVVTVTAYKPDGDRFRRVQPASLTPSN